MVMNRLKILSLLFLLILSFDAISQITSGKIIYERRTNLYKKFKDSDWVRNNLKERDKNKIDFFELYFSDSLTVFKPQENELKEMYGWATEKNTVYQNLNTETRLTSKEVWGEHVWLKDSLYNRQWKITDSKRNIAGYNCRKAIWNANDSTKIYAWFCNEINTSTGPESFVGLPGAILGIATEDGGVVYFAKSVEQIKPDVATLLPPKIKKTIYNPKELKDELQLQYGKMPWGKEMLKNLFGWW